MFQDFEDPPRVAVNERVAALRERLARDGLAGFVVPRADEHQNEYVPPSEERLAWLTGFTGSAGSAVVLADKAALFVDGRYTLQAANQVDGAVFEVLNIADVTPEAWIEANVAASQRLGCDPRLHTVAQAKRLEAAAEKAGARLVHTPNPIDELWIDRPAPPLGPVSLQPDALAGERAAEKLARIAAMLRKGKADALVVTAPDAIAWTFNIRGRDVAHTPLPLSFAVIRTEGRPVLAIDGRKLSNAVRDALAAVADLIEPAEFDAALDRLGAEGLVTRIDPQAVSARIAERLRTAGAKLQEGPDYIAPMKAVKNAAEIAGARAAHLRDGAALVRFLAWLDREAPAGRVDEIGAAEALARFRAETGLLEDLSFDTISGAGPNGAIVHYRVTRSSNRVLKPGTLYLVDSGGQYRDGTTDVTRTVAIGRPSAEMRDRFTRVLKGHIAIATARFPKGASGAQLDSLARISLWKAGLDYDHGTGHGVGSYLSVHEGPQRLSKIGTTPLEPGMILSNEPGYYKPGAYGIRIENLLLVTSPEPIEGGDRPMLAFETLTLAPIDLRLVDPTLLTADELDWLDSYHARVRRELSPLLDADDRAWLVTATRPLPGVANPEAIP